MAPDLHTAKSVEELCAIADGYQADNFDELCDFVAEFETCLKEMRCV